MPASARSLRITESYRTRMIGLRNRAKAEAKRTWARVDPDALDATFNPGMLVLMTSQLQREAARLSAGYLAAYVSSEKGERVPLPMAVGLDVGKVWTGSSLTKAFRGAVIGVKIQIAGGKPAIEAYKEGGQALVRTAGLAVDDVCRESLRVAMDHSPDVNGYVRAVKGTCEACLGAADGAKENPGEPLDTHPNCQCVSEPVVNARSPDDVLKPASAEDIAAAKRYVNNSDSFAINRVLRGEDVSDLRDWLRTEVDESIALIDKAVKPIGEPVRVFRGIRGTPKSLGFSEGSVFSDAGYGSTTSLEWRSRFARIAEGAESVEFDLAIDGKVKGIWGANLGEGELLLQRGCRYVIRSIRKDGRAWKVEATVLPPK